MLRWTWHLSVILALVVATAGCGTDDSDQALHVVATTSMLGDVAAAVVGDGGTVEVLMPRGADPHSFSPSSEQVAAMSRADLVVANGLGLEEGFEEVLEAVVADGGRVVEVGPMVDPLPFGEDHEHSESEDEDHEESEEAGHDHEHSDDPHIWMDPLRMGEAAQLIAAELAEIDPSSDWAGRAAGYEETMNGVDAQIIDLLSVVDAGDRILVTNHDSLGYFADRYGFEVIGTVLPGGTTIGDPSSEELAALVAIMREHGVTVIFAETTRPTALAEAVAAELGEDVQVVELYTGSLGEVGSDAGTLAGMLLANARAIAGALGAAG